MAEICPRVLDGFGMPAEWALGSDFKGRVISGTASATVMKLLEHGMKVVERVLGRIVTVD